MTPTKTQYEEALKVVKAYEARQQVLKNLESDLSFLLRKFDQVKFKVDKDKREVIFTGLHAPTNSVKLGHAIARKGDRFELLIGKVVAVKLALGESIEDVLKHVESEPTVEYKVDWLKAISTDIVAAKPYVGF